MGCVRSFALPDGQCTEKTYSTLELLLNRKIRKFRNIHKFGEGFFRDLSKCSFNKISTAEDFVGTFTEHLQYIQFSVQKYHENSLEK